MNNPRAWLEISTEALTHNVKALRSCCAGEVELIAVVKANAYGHGLPEVVRALHRTNVTWFGVDSIQEAEDLRRILEQAQIVVLGFIPDNQLDRVISLSVSPVLYDLEQALMLEERAAALDRTLSVHVKLETGTARQGVFPERLAAFLDGLEACPHLFVEGLATHLARAEDMDATEMTRQQLRTFYEAIEKISERLPQLRYVHAACSAAVLTATPSHGTAIRPGLALYGIWPSLDVELASAKEHPSVRLTPVLSWFTQVAQVKEYPAGTPIGYGGTEILSRPSRVAVVPVGYADGYDRRLSSVGHVLVRGQRCKVLGRVCMNMMMVDVSRVPSVARGERVTLIGFDGAERITVSELAETCGTIPWEIVSRIAPHLPRLSV